MENNKMTRSGIHLLVIFLLFAALLSGGCAKVRPIWDDIKSSMKRTGDQAISPLDQTRKRYSCAQHDTRFYVEKSELSPVQVSPGDKIKHVVQYSLCAPSDAVTVQGMLTRKIKFKGKEIKTDSDAQVFKAGTWTVNAFIEVPDKAPSGTYTLETIIRFEDRTIIRRGIFSVQE
jgi:hypothetical protein